MSTCTSRPNNELALWRKKAQNMNPRVRWIGVARSCSHSQVTGPEERLVARLREVGLTLPLPGPVQAQPGGRFTTQGEGGDVRRAWLQRGDGPLTPSCVKLFIPLV